MSNQLYVASRRGSFRIDRGRGEWTIGAAHFLGDNFSIVLADPRDGAVYAALDHGHFGAKLHRSDDGGTRGGRVAVRSYPEPPAGLRSPNPIPWDRSRLGSGADVVA